LVLFWTLCRSCSRRVSAPIYANLKNIADDHEVPTKKRPKGSQEELPSPTKVKEIVAVFAELHDLEPKMKEIMERYTRLDARIKLTITRICQSTGNKMHRAFDDLPNAKTASGIMEERDPGRGRLEFNAIHADVVLAAVKPLVAIMDYFRKNMKMSLGLIANFTIEMKAFPIGKILGKVVDWAHTVNPLLKDIMWDGDLTPDGTKRMKLLIETYRQMIWSLGTAYNKTQVQWQPMIKEMVSFRESGASNEVKWSEAQHIADLIGRMTQKVTERDQEKRETLRRTEELLSRYQYHYSGILVKLRMEVVALYIELQNNVPARTKVPQGCEIKNFDDLSGYEVFDVNNISPAKNKNEAIDDNNDGNSSDDSEGGSDSNSQSASDSDESDNDGEPSDNLKRLLVNTGVRSADDSEMKLGSETDNSGSDSEVSASSSSDEDVDNHILQKGGEEEDDLEMDMGEVQLEESSSPVTPRSQVKRELSLSPRRLDNGMPPSSKYLKV
jgi:hypothetical protein